MGTTKNIFVQDETGETVKAWDDTKRYASDNVAATMQSLWDQFGLLVDALEKIRQHACDQDMGPHRRLSDIEQLAYDASQDNGYIADLRARLETYGVNL